MKICLENKREIFGFSSFYVFLNSALTPQVTDLFNCRLNQNIFEDSYCRPVWHQLMTK